MTTRADLVARNTKHGAAKRRAETSEYRSWRGMIERCENSNHISYGYYGGRGIAVCERWRNDFSTFLADMGMKPTPQHQVDRYPDTNGNYEPSNCRWATPAEQRANQRPYDESVRVRKSWGNRSKISRQRPDMTGQRFERLVVIGYADSRGKRANWLCQCDCGNQTTVSGKSLRQGTTKSCGCLNRDKTRERAIRRNGTDNPAKYRWRKTD